MANPLSVSAKEFYEALWQASPPGFVELQLIRPNTKDAARPDEVLQWFFAHPGKIDEFIAKAKESDGYWNVYHGCATRSRMRGRNEDVLAITALWCDIDFKKTPQDQALKLISEFPVKPSAGFMTGGGFHIYWILKEPITGDDLKKVRPFNRAIATALGGDHNACDLRRVLRVPETTNLKYDTRPRTQIVSWRPEARPNLSDFDFLPVQETPAPAPSNNGDATHAEPALEIPDELVTKVSNLMREIWVKGYRHRLALYLSGLLAHAGYMREGAKNIIRAICALSQDEEAASREMSVDSSYNQFVSNGPVAGAPSLEKLIGEEFPIPIQEKAKKVFDLVRKSVPKTSKGKLEATADFEVVKYTKFNSRPARYTAEIKCKDGVIRHCTCETNVFYHYPMFRVAFFEENNVFLSAITQTRWELMIPKAKYEEKEAPKEARVDGAIETALEEFLRHRKENPDFGDLKGFAGFDEKHTFFRLATFKGFLRDQGIKAPDPLVTYQLRKMGWESEPKRFGDDVTRVWVGMEKANGHKPIDLFNPNQPQEPAPEIPLPTRARETPP